MSEVEEQSPTGVSRRTVAKAMAWTVPAIAVAATVPLAAASDRTCLPIDGITDPRVEIGVCDTCGNPGGSNKGCASNLQHYWQTPIYLNNPGPDELVFHVTSFQLNGIEYGAAGGAFGLYLATGTSSDDCTVVDQTCTTCTFTDNPNSFTCMPPAMARTKFWILSNDFGNSSSSTIRIEWELINAATCAPVTSGVSGAIFSSAPNNCTGNE